MALLSTPVLGLVCGTDSSEITTASTSEEGAAIGTLVSGMTTVGAVVEAVVGETAPGSFTVRGVLEGSEEEGAEDGTEEDEAQ